MIKATIIIALLVVTGLLGYFLINWLRSKKTENQDTIIAIATPIIEGFFHQKRGYKAGIAISLFLGLSGIILGIILGSILSWLMAFGKLESAAYFSPTLWMSIMLYLGFAWMIFESGKYAVEKNYQAVLSFFGTRLYYEEITKKDGEEDEVIPWGLVQGDGLNWYLPSWLFGGVELVDMRSFPVDLSKYQTEFNSADDFPMTVPTDLEIGVKNPLRHLTKKSPLQSTIDEAIDQLRYLIGSMTSADFKDQEKKKMLSERWRKGDPSGEGDAKGLEQEITQWGYGVYKAQIGNIRPPKEIEEANAKEQIERAQKKAERTEAEGVAELIDIYIGRGLSPEAAANMVQVERGKATREVKSYEAPDVIKAVSALSGVATAVVEAIAKSKEGPAKDAEPAQPEATPTPTEGEPSPVPFGAGGRRDNPKGK